MCGIVGYIGKRNAAPILMEGLHRLEYRGYDSAGIAVVGRTGELRLAKCKGRVRELDKLLPSGCPISVSALRRRRNPGNECRLTRQHAQSVGCVGRLRRRRHAAAIAEKA